MIHSHVFSHLNCHWCYKGKNAINQASKTFKIHKIQIVAITVKISGPGFSPGCFLSYMSQYLYYFFLF
jgi:hypothetical protein